MRKFAAIPLIAGALLASGVGLVVAGGTAQAAGCNTFAYGPYKSGANLKGSAGQSGASGACNGVSVNTSLRRDLQGLPDPTLATGSGSGNVTITMTGGGCVGGNVYYTSASSSSGSYTESGRTSPC